jgi:hypothetical protein
MTLTKALNNLAHDALKDGLPTPVIKMTPQALLSLSFSIEEDIGGRLYGADRHEGFQFAGIKFVPE